MSSIPATLQVAHTNAGTEANMAAVGGELKTLQAMRQSPQYLFVMTAEEKRAHDARIAELQARFTSLWDVLP
jgi:hypothetical protein